jgi:lipid-binding SYLF domain-containing protein
LLRAAAKYQICFASCAGKGETRRASLRGRGGITFPFLYGFGVAKTRLIFIFETAGALQGFVNQGWEFGASGSLSAAADNQGGMFTGAASVSPGVFVYQITDTGLAAQITATGTKFVRDDALN